MFFLEDWIRHINDIRSYDVIMGVHGAGLTNLHYMLPNRALIIEVFPECWCWHYHGRLLYGTKLAHHAQIRSLVIGTPCPVGDVIKEHNGCGGMVPINDENMAARLYMNRTSYANATEVGALMHELLTYVYENFLTLPMFQTVESTVPIVQMKK